MIEGLSYKSDFLKRTDLFLKIDDLIQKAHSFAQNKIFELTKIKASKFSNMDPYNNISRSFLVQTSI